MRLEHEDLIGETSRLKSAVNVPGFEEAQHRSEQAIIQAEKFKAAVDKPPGRNFFASDSIEMDGQVGQPPIFIPRVVGEGISDDFFHLTCHIDTTLKTKIEKGQFVDLDKLLPKDIWSEGGHSNGTKLEWVQSEGNTYLVPAKKTSKFNFCF